MKKLILAITLSLLAPTLAFAQATHEFAVYAYTDDGAGEVTIFSRFYLDPAELYADDSYLEENYPEPTETDAVIEAMWEHLQISEEEVTEQFTVEQSYFLLDEEDEWFVDLGIDLENDIAEVLIQHTFYVDSDDEEVLLEAGLERLQSITIEDLEERFNYYFIEEQGSSVYGVVVITDLFGSDVFSDVDDDYEYYDAVNYVYDYGIVEGYDDGTYRPESEINRAEFTKILMEAVYPGEAEQGSDCFSDVEASQWYAKYVCLAEEKDIVAGYSDGSFSPGNFINVAEALKITLETYFPGSFEEATSPWYQKYWDFAEAAGYLLTEWDSASENLSRGAMAELIYRIEN